MKQIVSNYDELYPGRFLKSGEVAHNPVYTIKEVYLDKLENDKGRDEPKGVISFEEIDQELTLNKTKGECLKGIFGKTIPEWIGKRVQLIVYPETFGKEKVDAVGIGGSPDIDADVTVHVTYRRRKAKTFVIKSLKTKKEQKKVFDMNNAKQVDAFMEYAVNEGWENAELMLYKYEITHENVAILKAKYDEATQPEAN
jgi:hypothetical protein